MSYHLNNEQKLTEIIFAHRNKAYGAYVLRSDYGFTIVKSLSIVIAGVASLAFAAYLFTRTVPEVDTSIQIIPDDVIVVPFTKKPDEVIPKTKTTTPPVTPPPPPETKNPNQNGAPLVIDSTKTDDSRVAVTTTFTSQITSSTSVPGINTDPKPNVVEDPIDVDKNGVASPFGLEKEAEFDGGLTALYKFIKENCRYPEEAFAAGVEGTMYVKFVVDENGKVSRLTLLNTRGYGLDEEALRVVGMLPKFKSPAKMKGQSVKSYYQVPIKFRISR
ncbi:MAG: energy transducer TonB [Bacteroidia bacterium]|nr:energy transducer TonB [Bacteroidia bacterium]